MERVVGRKCSLQCLEGTSACKENTRTLNIWVWTTNPSTIAKVIWITFANRSEAHAAEVSTSLPDQWRCGLTFWVIIHLDYIKDHTAAPLDDFITKSDIVSYEPITTRLPWSMGAVDGTPKSKHGNQQQEEGGGFQLERQREGNHQQLRLGWRQPWHRLNHDDHPLRITLWRKEEEDDNDNEDHHARGGRYAPRHSSSGGSKLRLGAGCDRDRSPW